MRVGIAQRQHTCTATTAVAPHHTGKGPLPSREERRSVCTLYRVGSLCTATTPFSRLTRAVSTSPATTWWPTSIAESRSSSVARMSSSPTSLRRGSPARSNTFSAARSTSASLLRLFVRILYSASSAGSTSVAIRRWPAALPAGLIPPCDRQTRCPRIAGARHCSPSLRVPVHTAAHPDSAATSSTDRDVSGRPSR